MAKNIRRRTAGQVSGESIVIEAAWMYYHDGLNQNEIAGKLNVSRATVVNYLQDARERGYIRISLTSDAFTTHRLALELCDAFGLKSAYILPDGIGDSEDIFLRVSKGAAQWLPDLLNKGDRLGGSWGRTVYEVAEALEQTSIEDLTVSQLVGSMATPYGFTAEICSAHLAQRLEGRLINLHAPAILRDPDLAERLRQEPIISSQLDALSHCNKAIFAAGSCLSNSHIVGSGVATPEELSWYVEQGATGVLCGRLIDREGKPVAGALDDRMIGVTLDKLVGLEMGMLVSVGDEKVIPMLSAIAGGYVTHLVTSSETAKSMLETAK